MVFVERILFSEREVKGMSLAAIYAGRGTSSLSIRGARVMLEEKGLEVTLVSAKELATTLQEPNCRLLGIAFDVPAEVEKDEIEVMPGGRDRPYHASLGEEGALRIRSRLSFQSTLSTETQGSLWRRGVLILASAQAPYQLCFLS